jgi:hypothetical protein
MCPDCIAVIAVAVAAATPLSAVKGLFARTSERLSPQAKENFDHDYQSNRAPERRLAWRMARRPQGIVG